MSDVWAVKSLNGASTLASIDDSGNLSLLGVLTSTGTDDFGTLGIKADVIAESTSAAGVTVDGVQMKDGAVYSDQFVFAAITAANASGGATDAALTVDLYRDAAKAVRVASARYIVINGFTGQYASTFTSDSSPTYGTATKGSILGSGNGECVALTDANGEFDCTVSNATDETLYFQVRTLMSVPDFTKACVVVSSESDAATWSA